jgi:hypothetical protein
MIMTEYNIFPSPGVLIRANGDNAYHAAISSAVINEDNMLDVSFLQPPAKSFPVDFDNLSINSNTGIITFNVFDADYTLRPFRDEDGQWLSKFQVDLPVEALNQIVNRESKASYMSYMPGSVMPQDESITAVAYEGSQYIVGLLYNNDLGNWARIGGDWVLLNAVDNSYDDTVAFPISFVGAQDLLDAYDSKQLTINDIQPYLDSDSDTEG